MLRINGIIKCFLLPRLYSIESNCGLRIRNMVKLANSWMLDPVSLSISHVTLIRKLNLSDYLSICNFNPHQDDFRASFNKDYIKVQYKKRGNRSPNRNVSTVQ